MHYAQKHSIDMDVQKDILWPITVQKRCAAIAAVVYFGRIPTFTKIDSELTSTMPSISVHVIVWIDFKSHDERA